MNKYPKCTIPIDACPQCGQGDMTYIIDACLSHEEFTEFCKKCGYPYVKWEIQT